MRLDRATLKAILQATYTPLDLRKFVQLCYDLALPHIRKKIAAGKINLSIMGLREPDVVYDCVADLFQRNEDGNFPQIQVFFRREVEDIHVASEEELLVTLRRIVIGKVNNNIIRLYSEADPALGKILRNLRLALDRTRLFDQVTRFNEHYLIPHETDPLFERPPMSEDHLRHEFSRTDHVDETIPEMLQKLQHTLAAQTEFQRAVPLVTAARMFKEAYVLGWDSPSKAPAEAQEILESQDIRRVVQDTVEGLHRRLYARYVEKGKCTAVQFDEYMNTVKDILLAGTDGETSDHLSYYQHLNKYAPELSETMYRKERRTMLEYFVKLAKERIRQELRK